MPRRIRQQYFLAAARRHGRDDARILAGLGWDAAGGAPAADAAVNEIGGRPARRAEGGAALPLRQPGGVEDPNVVGGGEEGRVGARVGEGEGVRIRGVREQVEAEEGRPGAVGVEAEEARDALPPGAEQRIQLVPAARRSGRASPGPRASPAATGVRWRG